MRRILTVIAVMAALLTMPACKRDGPATPTPAPTPTATAPTVGPSSAPASGKALAVYYTLTRPNDKPRLVREFHEAAPVPDPAAQVRAAVMEMLTRKPFDPDYENLWPDTVKVLNVTIAGDIATVDLAGAATANLGSEGAAVALAQLVWTVTAVPDISAVRLMLEGTLATELWGVLDISQPQRRAAAYTTIHPVWLISPQHGERVGRQVTLHIAGVAFEATVNYYIKREATVVKQGYVSLSTGAPEFGETKQVVTLDQPGTYVIAVYLESSQDGSIEAIDDHTVTVN